MVFSPEALCADEDWSQQSQQKYKRPPGEGGLWNYRNDGLAAKSGQCETVDLLHLTRNLSPGDRAPTNHLHPTIAGGSEDVVRPPVIVVDRQSRFDSTALHPIRRNDREPEVP